MAEQSFTTPYLSREKSRPEMLLLSLPIIFALLLTACGGGTAQQQKSSIISVPWGGPFIENFNPWSPTYQPGTRGMTYETLLYVNVLQGTVTPWLASGYDFSKDATTLIFHLRPNVQWSDGQPFSSADVVFTLNMLKQYPGADLNSLWIYLKSVTAPDANTVIVTLKKPYSPILWYLGAQSWIVPQHIWSSIGDPTKFTNPKPVGTGPFVLKSFNAQLIDLNKNPKYWQPGKPEVKELRYLNFDSNTSEELALKRGTVDWDGQFLPRVQESFVNLDPAHNHYWFPSTNTVMFYLNLTKSPFNLLPVRQAISLAIDRQQLNVQGESGYEPPAHPTGLVLPAQRKFLSSDYAQESFTVDAGKATQLLENAGFRKGSDGIFADSHGKKLAFNMNVVTGWTDWITDLQIIASNLKAIGIAATVNALAFNSYLNTLQTGNFDTAISWTNNGSSPFFPLDGMLNSKNTAAIGKNAISNWGRWNDPATDRLLEQYASTTDTNAQKQAIYGLEKIMVEQIPAIPLIYGPSWSEYSTKHFTGWPSANDPYALPQPAAHPDDEMLILHLHPVG